MLRSVHEAALREAFRAGEHIGRLDGIAAERERVLRIMFTAEEVGLPQMGRILAAENIEVDQARGILRIAAGMAPQDPADTPFDDPKPRSSAC